MAYEKRDGDGVLFKNDRKEKDTHPDYQGSIVIGGVEHWLSAWIKEGQKGKFMSLSAKPKQDAAQKIKQSSQKPKQQPMRYGDDESYGRQPADFDDQDVPF